MITPTDTELEIECARRMGWTGVIMQDLERPHPNDRRPAPHGFKPGNSSYRSEVPGYTDSLGDAMELVKKAKERGFWFSLMRTDDPNTPGEWLCVIFKPNNGNEEYLGGGDSPARAICLAFLAIHEPKTPQP